MEIVAVAIQKGGTGKTTTTSALFSGLLRRGYKVLAVDLDAQANLSYCFGQRENSVTTLEMLTGSATAEQAIAHTTRGDIIPAKSGLALASSMLSQDMNQDYKLKEALDTLQGRYDYVIIDCPPSLDLLTRNALTACNTVIIPADANDIFSVMGIGDIAQTILAIKKYRNTAIQVDGLLATRLKSNTTIGKGITQMLQQTADELGTKLYSTVIRDCSAIKEANAEQTDIFTYAPHSNAAKDYNAVIDEFLSKRGK